MIDDTVEQLARWLHDETGHPDSYPDHTWPETERDDGRREGGWVKIVPQHAQAYFRDIARRMVARFPLNESQAAPEWQLIETARHKDGERILGWDGKQQFTCYFRGEHHKPHQDKPGWHDQWIRMHPTHWKPLGSPPVSRPNRESGK